MKTENPLKSNASYNLYLANALNRSSITHSTVGSWSDSPYTGIAEGQVFFLNNIRLRFREELDFDAGLITSYGYEVYQNEERLYWYDDFPHPNDADLALTFPHHKHVPPNIKRNRIPADKMSFTKPNILRVIEEIEAL